MRRSPRTRSRHEDDKTTVQGVPRQARGPSGKPTHADEEEVRYAEEAGRILESDAYQEACRRYEERLVRKWKKCMEGTEKREALWHAVQEADGITKELKTMIGTERMEVTSE